MARRINLISIINKQVRHVIKAPNVVQYNVCLVFGYNNSERSTWGWKMTSEQFSTVQSLNTFLTLKKHLWLWHCREKIIKALFKAMFSAFDI